MTIESFTSPGKGTRKRFAAALAKRWMQNLSDRTGRDVHIEREGFKAFLKMKSPVKPMTTGLCRIDTLVVATPVWAESPGIC
jgi:hypothetical protein